MRIARTQVVGRNGLRTVFRIDGEDLDEGFVHRGAAVFGGRNVSASWLLCEDHPSIGLPVVDIRSTTGCVEVVTDGNSQRDLAILATTRGALDSWVRCVSIAKM
jgi:hypothetical protein